MSYEASLVTQLAAGVISSQQGAQRIIEERQKAREIRGSKVRRVAKLVLLILAGAILGPFMSGDKQA